MVGGTQQISKKLIEFVLDDVNKDENRHNKLMLNTTVIHIIQNENDEHELVQVVTANTVNGEKQTFKAKKVFHHNLLQYIVFAFYFREPICNMNL